MIVIGPACGEERAAGEVDLVRFRLFVCLYVYCRVSSNLHKLDMIGPACSGERVAGEVDLVMFRAKHPPV